MAAQEEGLTDDNGTVTRPSTVGQEAVIRKAYVDAGDLSFSDTTYFECHGTGTPVGDPIEVSAVGNVFASTRSGAPEDRLRIGSVKTNLGHTGGASAIAAVMKVVLSLEAEEIPPNFGVEMLNPNIDFNAAQVEVVRELTPWPKDKTRRASINSFGFGGANGHCIIDHVNEVMPTYVKIYRAPEVNGHGLNEPTANDFNHTHTNKQSRKMHRANTKVRQRVLLSFSAHNKHSLKSNIGALSTVISQWPLADIAYTLGRRRSKLAQRSYRVVDKDNIDEGLRLSKPVFTAPAQPAQVGFVFTGQGAQWHSMGAGLFEYRVFRASIEFLDYVLGYVLSTPHSWTLQDILSGNCAENFFQTPEISQVACTAVQIGMVDLLASWSVRPVGVLGHSSGEIAAAYASGRITAAEAITAAYFRGHAISRNSISGAMLAVSLGPKEAMEYLVEYEGVEIAAINSPESVTLSGDAESVLALSEMLSSKSVFNRLLRTGGNAYHSRHMTYIGRDYEDMLSIGLASVRKLQGDWKQSTNIQWVSSVMPNQDMSGIEITASYWTANLEGPVRFCDAVTSLVGSEGNQIDILVEIGPHPVVKGPIDQTLKSLDKLVPYVPSLKRKENNQLSILELAGTLFSLNVDIDLVSVNAVDSVDSERGCLAVDLPPYQYSYGPPIYHESRLSKDYRLRKKIRHDLLGSKISGSSRLYPQWRNILRIKDVPWLGHHRLIPEAVFPAAGYLTMAIEAAKRSYGEFSNPLEITGYSLRSVEIKAALRIPEDDRGIEVIFSMQVANTTTSDLPGWAHFSISTVNSDESEWSEHCTGSIKIEVFKPNEVEKIDDGGDWRVVDARSWYKKFEDIGLSYGPRFRLLSKIHGDPSKMMAMAELVSCTTSDTMEGGESEYPLHPAALDATFQLGLIACHGGQVKKAHTAFVPVHMSNIFLKNNIDQGQAHVVTARGELRGLRGAYIQLQMLNQAGDIVLDLDNLRCISYREPMSSDRVNSRAFSSPFARLVWKPDIRALNKAQCHRMFAPPTENVEKVVIVRDLNKLASLIVFDIYESHGRTQDDLTPSGNVGHFFSWVKRHASGDQTEFMTDARRLSSQARKQIIEDLTGVDILVNDGTLSALYETGLFMTSAYPQLFRILDSLGHANPNLRILELGAGTGGATRVVMKALSDSNGIKRYRDYTFTEISPGFLASAQESMKVFNDMIFSVLDIEQDSSKEGFEPVYDVVIASQTLHATRSISRTLRNCRKLLRPGGKLGKNETVLDTLRYLPYLRSNSQSYRLLVYWETIPIRYRDDTGSQEIYPLLSHCVYHNRSADREGINLILDTIEGTITEFSHVGYHITIPHEDYEALPEAEKWKAHRTSPITELLDSWTRWMLVPNPIDTDMSAHRAFGPAHQDDGQPQFQILGQLGNAVPQQYAPPHNPEALFRAGAFIPPIVQYAGVPQNEPLVCIVCQEKFNFRDLCLIMCGHPHCKDCLRRNASLALASNPFNPAKCCRVIPKESLHQFGALTHQELEQYSAKIEELTTPRGRLYCWACRAFIPAANRKKRVGECLEYGGCNHMSCVCGQDFCYLCGQVYGYVNHNCQQAHQQLQQQLQAQQAQQQITQQALLAQQLGQQL
ncbi:hypothetical protein GQX73_g5049 [Xylaria multiplex]|uniref:Carrier domain-containing protein n=1 Tax=Xylaria multiplex TaxID=323545 RepID=A0A7C8MU13_9PEZI|nr:hypothetical protein GQX73_g5049 [Xylaria multiplex]